MKSEGFLTAERALAQHSDMLAARVPESTQLEAVLAAAAPRLERGLADALATLLGDEKPAIECGKVEKLTSSKLHKIVDLVAVNYLFDDGAGTQVFASLDLASALSLTDRVFGGTGTPITPLPDRLPNAANMTLARFADALGEALGTAFERPEPLELTARSDVLGKIIRASEEEEYFSLRCPITLGDSKPWDLIIAMRQSHLARLAADADQPLPAPSSPKNTDFCAATFGGLPMPVRAVLAEMQMPVSRIAALRPGDSIPIAIAQEVPLRIQDVEIARGQIGNTDGNLALKITRTNWNTKEFSHD